MANESGIETTKEHEQQSDSTHKDVRPGIPGANDQGSCCGACTGPHDPCENCTAISGCKGAERLEPETTTSIEKSEQGGVQSQEVAAESTEEISKEVGSPTAPMRKPSTLGKRPMEIPETPPRRAPPEDATSSNSAIHILTPFTSDLLKSPHVDEETRQKLHEWARDRKTFKVLKQILEEATPKIEITIKETSRDLEESTAQSIMQWLEEGQSQGLWEVRTLEKIVTPTKKRCQKGKSKDASHDHCGEVRDRRESPCLEKPTSDGYGPDDSEETGQGDSKTALIPLVLRPSNSEFESEAPGSSTCTSLVRLPRPPTGPSDAVPAKSWSPPRTCEPAVPTSGLSLSNEDFSFLAGILQDTITNNSQLEQDLNHNTQVVVSLRLAAQVVLKALAPHARAPGRVQERISGTVEESETEEPEEAATEGAGESGHPADQDATLDDGSRTAGRDPPVAKFSLLGSGPGIPSGRVRLRGGGSDDNTSPSSNNDEDSKRPRERETQAQTSKNHVSTIISIYSDPGQLPPYTETQERSPSVVVEQPSPSASPDTSAKLRAKEPPRTPERKSMAGELRTPSTKSSTMSNASSTSPPPEMSMGQIFKGVAHTPEHIRRAAEAQSQKEAKTSSLMDLAAMVLTGTGYSPERSDPFASSPPRPSRVNQCGALILHDPSAESQRSRSLSANDASRNCEASRRSEVEKKALLRKSEGMEPNEAGVIVAGASIPQRNHPATDPESSGSTDEGQEEDESEEDDAASEDEDEDQDGDICGVCGGYYKGGASGDEDDDGGDNGGAGGAGAGGGGDEDENEDSGHGDDDKKPKKDPNEKEDEEEEEEGEDEEEDDDESEDKFHEAKEFPDQEEKEDCDEDAGAYDNVAYGYREKSSPAKDTASKVEEEGPKTIGHEYISALFKQFQETEKERFDPEKTKNDTTENRDRKRDESSDDQGEDCETATANSATPPRRLGCSGCGKGRGLAANRACNQGTGRGRGRGATFSTDQQDSNDDSMNFQRGIQESRLTAAEQETKDLEDALQNSLETAEEERKRNEAEALAKSRAEKEGRKWEGNKNEEDSSGTKQNDAEPGMVNLIFTGIVIGAEEDIESPVEPTPTTDNNDTDTTAIGVLPQPKPDLPFIKLPTRPPKPENRVPTQGATTGEESDLPIVTMDPDYLDAEIDTAIFEGMTPHEAERSEHFLRCEAARVAKLERKQEEDFLREDRPAEIEKEIDSEEDDVSVPDDEPEGFTEIVRECDHSLDTNSHEEMDTISDQGSNRDTPEGERQPAGLTDGYHHDGHILDAAREEIARIGGLTDKTQRDEEILEAAIRDVLRITTRNHRVHEEMAALRGNLQGRRRTSVRGGGRFDEAQQTTQEPVKQSEQPSEQQPDQKPDSETTSTNDSAPTIDATSSDSGMETSTPPPKNVCGKSPPTEHSEADAAEKLELRKKKGKMIDENNTSISPLKLSASPGLHMLKKPATSPFTPLRLIDRQSHLTPPSQRGERALTPPDPRTHPWRPVVDVLPPLPDTPERPAGSTAEYGKETPTQPRVVEEHSDPVGSEPPVHNISLPIRTRPTQVDSGLEGTGTGADGNRSVDTLADADVDVDLDTSDGENNNADTDPDVQPETDAPKKKVRGPSRQIGKAKIIRPENRPPEKGSPKKPVGRVNNNGEIRKPSMLTPSALYEASTSQDGTPAADDSASTENQPATEEQEATEGQVTSQAEAPSEEHPTKEDDVVDAAEEGRDNGQCTEECATPSQPLVQLRSEMYTEGSAPKIVHVEKRHIGPGKPMSAKKAHQLMQSFLGGDGNTIIVGGPFGQERGVTVDGEAVEGDTVGTAVGGNGDAGEQRPAEADTRTPAVERAVESPGLGLGKVKKRSRPLTRVASIKGEDGAPEEEEGPDWNRGENEKGEEGGGDGDDVGDGADDDASETGTVVVSDMHDRQVEDEEEAEGGEGKEKGGEDEDEDGGMEQDGEKEKRKKGKGKNEKDTEG